MRAFAFFVAVALTTLSGFLSLSSSAAVFSSGATAFQVSTHRAFNILPVE